MKRRDLIQRVLALAAASAVPFIRTAESVAQRIHREVATWGTGSRFMEYPVGGPTDAISRQWIGFIVDKRDVVQAWVRRGDLMVFWKTMDGAGTLERGSRLLNPNR